MVIFLCGHCPWYVLACFTRPHGMFLVLYISGANHKRGPPLCETGTYMGGPRMGHGQHITMIYIYMVQVCRPHPPPPPKGSGCTGFCM